MVVTYNDADGEDVFYNWSMFTLNNFKSDFSYKSKMEELMNRNEEARKYTYYSMVTSTSKMHISTHMSSFVSAVTGISPFQSK